MGLGAVTLERKIKNTGDPESVPARLGKVFFGVSLLDLLLKLACTPLVSWSNFGGSPGFRTTDIPHIHCHAFLRSFPISVIDCVLSIVPMTRNMLLLVRKQDHLHTDRKSVV